jgi:hypothetical protein
MMNSASDQDREHLRLLTIFWYIWAGIEAAAGLIGFAFIAMGVFISTSPQVARSNNPPPPWFGAMFAGMGGLFLVTVEATAVLSLLTGRFLSRRQHPTFCIVISAINCMSMPLGTALGVFTILVLQRPSVKALFDGSAPPGSAPPPMPA